MTFYLTSYIEIRMDNQGLAEHKLWGSFINSSQAGGSMFHIKDGNPFRFCVRTQGKRANLAAVLGMF